jgi:hypothetical protein
MSTAVVTLIVFACVFCAALLGMWLRSLLPEHHLNSETKDTVKMAMGFVATMSALILGLLVASAKSSYDQEASGVTEMAAKIIYLDRLLANFGPETADTRAMYRDVVQRISDRMWPDDASDEVQLDPRATKTEELFAAIQSLDAKDDRQKTLKSEAISTCLDLGQMRWLEYEQAGASASAPLLCILVFWTSVLFASFGLFAPRNGTVIAAMFLAALSVAGAIFLIEELRSPFRGMLQIPKTAFVDAAQHLGT